jgi:hypothetical protein
MRVAIYKDGPDIHRQSALCSAAYFVHVVYARRLAARPVDVLRPQYAHGLDIGRAVPRHLGTWPLGERASGVVMSFPYPARYLCIRRHVGHGQVQAATLIDGLTEQRELTS